MGTPTVPTLTVTRYRQSKLSTISRFMFTAPGFAIKGYTLEPSGPSTTASGQNKRIPVGKYKLASHSGAKYKRVVNVYNDQVPRSRAILMHQGNTPSNTVGCLLVGATVATDFVGESVKKLKELMDALYKVGPENVCLIIKEEFETNI